MGKKLKHLALISFLALSACASSGSLTQEEREYYQQIEKVHTLIKPVQSLSNSSKMSKVRYEMTVAQMTEGTRAILDRYRDSEFASRPSFEAITRAYESYIVARNLWQEDKGLALVNKRLDEGNRWMDKAEKTITVEKDPKAGKG
jgi:hypothetical protein